MAKVLIVDDEPAFREILCRQALRLGHEVETAADAASAVECGRWFGPDILFVDWMLKSELNGFDVVRLLRQDAPDLITIVISGDLSFELPSELMETGEVSFLPKPFGLADFKTALDDAIASL